MNASPRWLALDALRAISVIGMLLNLNPGSWEWQFSWLFHAEWIGWTLIDMVFPGFLFCVGVALALSLDGRVRAGATRSALTLQLLRRGVILVIVGVLLNAYPVFDWSHVRLPGVLQRIGICGAMVGLLLLLTSRFERGRGLEMRPGVIAAVSIGILVLYWALLYFVPAPGYGAPRFDSVGSWPVVIDRELFGLQHLWIYGTTEGLVTYDPEGLLSTFPACVNVMAGVLTAYWIRQRPVQQPAFAAVVAGAGMMLLAIALEGWCPISKKLWTSTFALLSSGFSLVLLGMLTTLLKRSVEPRWMLPLQVFGANALLAYIVCNAIAPLLDMNLFADPAAASIRQAGFAALGTFLPSAWASFVFSLIVLGLIFAVLLPLYRRRWFIRL
ncbi:MAG TPA: DUF5009 domain-containing protein [Povalibacter sp.]